MEQPQTACPRCGYDQTGAISAWERLDPPRCPLEETCTECGLLFAWRDVLNPLFRRELRFFENAKSGIGQAFRLTWWKSARPWAFWKWVKMEHELAPRRIVLLVLIGVLLSHIIIVSTLGLLSLGSLLLDGGWIARYWNFFPNDPVEGLLFALYPFGHHNWDWQSAIFYDPIRPTELIALGGVFAMPLTFVCLPQTLRRARVRKRHLVRIWAYSLVWLPVPASAAVAVCLVAEVVNRVETTMGNSVSWLDAWTRAGTSWAVLVTIFLWLAVWWSFAAGRYLRLPHAPAIGLAMTLVAMLAATLLTLMCPGGMWVMYSL